MELTILDSILHGSLKPWLPDNAQAKRLTELAKSAKVANPANLADLQKQLSVLLADHPTQQSTLNEKFSSTFLLHPLYYEISLPLYNDAISYFYYTLITAEIKRLYNSFLHQSALWSEPVDKQYEVNKLLMNAKVLLKETASEMIEQEFTGQPDVQASAVHFVLYYLKSSLIQLFYSIHDSFLDSVAAPISIEDLYILELGEPAVEKLQLQRSADSLVAIQKEQVKQKKQPVLTFGFEGKKDRLKKLVDQLCIHIELLKEEQSPADLLVQLLVAKNIKPGEVKIYLNCDNKNFRKVVETLQPEFSALNFINIEHSQSFISKQGTPLKANNLSKARSFDPKEKTEIESIFNQVK